MNKRDKGKVEVQYFNGSGHSLMPSPYEEIPPGAMYSRWIFHPDKGEGYTTYFEFHTYRKPGGIWEAIEEDNLPSKPFWRRQHE